MNFAIIAALDVQRGIGRNNDLAWHLSADLKHFKEVTNGGIVIMGRKTWESLPEAFRPLKNRSNIVISRSDLDLPEGVFLAHSLDEALKLAESHGLQPDAGVKPGASVRPDGGVKQAFVIGGATLYAEAILHPACTELYLTHVEGSFDCDVFFPEYDRLFALSAREPEKVETPADWKPISFYFAHYSRK